MNDQDQPARNNSELQRAPEPELLIDSVTLERLREEVRNGNSVAPGAYNRVHNRHNR
jgi:hypothetical protein